MNQDNQNILILYIYAFPFGGAATNRILAYAKGMIVNGAKVTVVVTVVR